MTQTRRRFLAGLGAAATAPAVFSGISAAAYKHQPSEVTLTYDEDVLETYRPRLIVRNLDIEPSWLYSWVATHENKDTNVAAYWAWYETQVSPLRAASHRADREPLYVFYDPDTGAINRVIVDGYHYYAARYAGEQIPFQDGDDTRSTWTPQNPYHFYQPGGTAGSDIDLANMHDRYEDWLANDWGVHRPAVVNPWIMTERSHWWPEGSFGFSLMATLYGAAEAVGLFGADDADTGATDA